MLRRVSPRVLVVASALVLLTATFFLVRGGEETRTVTAHLPRAVSVYPATDVRILGVSVGEVTAVVPEGNSVRVEMEYSAEYQVPADAKAVVVAPTLVADRFVQLTPAYSGGEVMADGGEIPLPDTGVPVELDRIYSSLQNLSRTLGPNGVNQDGTLNHLLQAGAENLDGTGRLGNRALREFSRAAETMGKNSESLFDTVEELGKFTEVLAKNDRLVRAFIKDLAGVSGQLAQERQELRRVLAEVAGAVGEVRSFVRNNRDALTEDVRRLTKVTRAVAAKRESLDDTLRVAPTAIANLGLAFNVESGSIGSRFALDGNIADLDGFLCSIIQQTDISQRLTDLGCTLFEQLVAGQQAKGGGGLSLPELRQRLQNPRPASSVVRDTEGPVIPEQTRFAPDHEGSLTDLVGGRS